MYPYYGGGIALAMDGGDTAAKEESAPASDADGTASTLPTKEDSFGTNNQVSARRINTLFSPSVLLNLLFSSLHCYSSL